MKSRLWQWYETMSEQFTDYEISAGLHNGDFIAPDWLAYSLTSAIGFVIWDTDVSDGTTNLINLEPTALINIQDMTKLEFTSAFNAAEHGDYITDNIIKLYSPENGGHTYIAFDTDHGENNIIKYWFDDEIEINSFIPSLNAFL